MDLIRDWNRWYDALPEPIRAPMVVGVLIVVGAVNMALTIGSGFPFGLLVLLAIIALAAIRMPYIWSGDAASAPEDPVLYSAPPHSTWAHDLNTKFNEVPELYRFPVILGVLAVIGAINMALTIGGGFPFGLLVLIAIVLIAAIRVPYTLGLGHPVAATAPVGAPAATLGAPPAAIPPPDTQIMPAVSTDAAAPKLDPQI